ncbi:kunitz/Bovine pancreatic trypsin inhibitor domain-containing protein [Ditylenchus destructor]|uniref:Kunitz/Bovine pancreatic trypsin inhibitor domain-containing protein n=1 Tax=Ditylenchus destructor TaxID=166010 RepID=A0AAD4MGV0_9BILA|nr:kunitz/Bovine pancreatic trypsin inhibitor domain-containing protein [Ditylenchus destructor]
MSNVIAFSVIVLCAMHIYVFLYTISSISYITYIPVRHQPADGRTRNVCFHSIRPGQCDGHMSRYGYDSSKYRCVKFIYGGCGGNKNNFETLAECEHLCEENDLPPANPSKAVCLHGIDPGECDDDVNSNLSRYGYDWEIKKCIAFKYTGCRGNKNKFETLEECQNFCKMEK